MNEELETAIKNIQDNIERWETECHEDNKLSIAKKLQFQLTMLKLLVGISNFDKLSYFSRVLKEVDNFISESECNKKEGGAI